jgi:hypothetical protein
MSQDGSFTNIYERIPETKFPEVINRFVNGTIDIIAIISMVPFARANTTYW